MPVSTRSFSNLLMLRHLLSRFGAGSTVSDDVRDLGEEFAKLGEIICRDARCGKMLRRPLVSPGDEVQDPCGEVEQGNIRGLRYGIGSLPCGFGLGTALRAIAVDLAR